MLTVVSDAFVATAAFCQSFNNQQRLLCQCLVVLNLKLCMFDVLSEFELEMGFVTFVLHEI
jgi:hypothetical protein